jgi:hypothetical protein
MGRVGEAGVSVDLCWLVYSHNTMAAALKLSSTHAAIRYIHTFLLPYTPKHPSTHTPMYLDTLPTCACEQASYHHHPRQQRHRPHYQV